MKGKKKIFLGKNIEEIKNQTFTKLKNHQNQGLKTQKNRSQKSDLNISIPQDHQKSKNMSLTKEIYQNYSKKITQNNIDISKFINLTKQLTIKFYGQFNIQENDFGEQSKQKNDNKKALRTKLYRTCGKLLNVQKSHHEVSSESILIQQIHKISKENDMVDKLYSIKQPQQLEMLFEQIAQWLTCYRRHIEEELKQPFQDQHFNDKIDCIIKSRLTYLFFFLDIIILRYKTQGENSINNNKLTIKSKNKKTQKIKNKKKLCKNNKNNKTHHIKKQKKSSKRPSKQIKNRQRKIKIQKIQQQYSEDSFKTFSQAKSIQKQQIIEQQINAQQAQGFNVKSGQVNFKTDLK